MIEIGHSLDQWNAHQVVHFYLNDKYPFASLILLLSYQITFIIFSFSLIRSYSNILFIKSRIG